MPFQLVFFMFFISCCYLASKHADAGRATERRVPDGVAGAGHSHTMQTPTAPVPWDSTAPVTLPAHMVDSSGRRPPGEAPTLLAVDLVHWQTAVNEMQTAFTGRPAVDAGV